MIELRKLNNESIFINPDLIRFIEKTPDSVLTFVNGEKIVVLEKPDEIIDRIIKYRKACSLPEII